mgnify:FL=1
MFLDNAVEFGKLSIVLALFHSVHIKLQVSSYFFGLIDHQGLDLTKLLTNKPLFPRQI